MPTPDHASQRRAGPQRGAEQSIHVVVLHRRYAGLILQGCKTAECRLSVQRRPPFTRLHEGERLYLKIAGGPFVATAIAATVHRREHLNPQAIEALQRRWEPRVLGGPEFWQRAAPRARYATIVELASVQPIAFGPAEPPTRTRAGWRVLPTEACVYPACVGTLAAHLAALSLSNVTIAPRIGPPPNPLL